MNALSLCFFKFLAPKLLQVGARCYVSLMTPGPRRWRWLWHGLTRPHCMLGGFVLGLVLWLVSVCAKLVKASCVARLCKTYGLKFADSVEGCQSRVLGTSPLTLTCAAWLVASGCDLNEPQRRDILALLVMVFVSVGIHMGELCEPASCVLTYVIASGFMPAPVAKLWALAALYRPTFPRGDMLQKCIDKRNAGETDAQIREFLAPCTRVRRSQLMSASRKLSDASDASAPPTGHAEPSSGQNQARFEFQLCVLICWIGYAYRFLYSDRITINFL